MHLEIICSKCNNTIYKMRVLRSIRSILKDNKHCPHCNALLSMEFSISAEKF
jgi:NAD-dependent SIR2 family protein deacetylase